MYNARIVGILRDLYVDIEKSKAYTKQGLQRRLMILRWWATYLEQGNLGSFWIEYDTGMRLLPDETGDILDRVFWRLGIELIEEFKDQLESA